MSEYQPIFRSPVTIPESGSGALRISDLTGAPLVRIQGDAAPALEALFRQGPAEPGDVVDVGQGLLARLRRDRFYLFGLTQTAELPSAAALAAQCQELGLFAQSTDAAHAVAALKLSGAGAAELLSKICGLDFHDSAFSDRQVRQTSAAKVKTLIVRRDEDGLPNYHLHVSRPLGQYFLDTLWDAGREFGIG